MRYNSVSMRHVIITIGLFLSGFLIAGCTANQPDAGGDVAAMAVDNAVVLESETAVSTPIPSLQNPPTPEVTPVGEGSALPQPPTITPVPTLETPTPLVPTEIPATPTATPIGVCSQRIPSDDLFTLVTQTYNLSRDYAPKDLVLLTDYLAMDVTLGYPSEIREVALQPLLTLINDMKAEGLQPQIISGYRSYSGQSIAWNKWSTEMPERASIISARPGHSEHQLGTVVDFGSPSLPDIVGDPDIEFHTYFFKTPEGIWLLENAHLYGFTLSYTREASEITGFFYEPWHYRYVGVEMATQLKEVGLTLTEFQLANQPEPCIPD
ncbi:MAG: D-alanyl-D-alanine carboxypeptidase family protein [Anaerolineae bacterium]|nr:D-alanyl-D-alanine carboxypeptidase family protein [Anaerolineae bacterium]